MQRRAFGIESEYSAACKGKGGAFHTAVSIPRRGGMQVFSASTMLAGAMMYRHSFPEHLKRLCFWGKENPQLRGNYWLGSNGARFYFDSPDNAPEYATPECGSVREAVLHSIAGDTIVEDIRQEAVRRGVMEGMLGDEWRDLFVFRMNTHFRSDMSEQKATGCHENYMVKAALEHSGAFSNFMAPFLVTRQIFDGSGGVRYAPNRGWHYVISQRIFFMDSLPVGGGTTFHRALVHFRGDNDEAPHGYSRLHLHCGDATMSPFGKYLAMAATHLVLRAYEEGDPSSWELHFPGSFLADALKCAMDPTLRTPLCVRRGQSSEAFLTAPEIQMEYLRFVKENVLSFSKEEARALREWEAMSETLREDPMAAARELDWAIKLRYLRERCDALWESPKTQFASALYHDISDRGIYRRLLKAGEIKRFAEPEEIMACRECPPKTRAEFRSRYIKALCERPDDTVGGVLWGRFGAPIDPVYIRSPFVRTTVEGERLLRKLK